MNKPKLAIILLVISLIMVSFASATLNLAPGKLYFNLNPGQQQCQKVAVFSSDYSGILKVRDVWNNDLHEQNLNKYSLTSKNLGLDISYPKQIDNFNRQQEFEVCLVGSNSGQFRGNLIFTPTSNTNIVVEVGTWLFVNVSGTVTSQTTQITPNKETPEIIVPQVVTEETGKIAETSTNQEAQTTEPTTSGITGNVVGGSGGKTMGIIIGVIFVVLIAGIFIYIKRRGRLKSEGYI